MAAETHFTLKVKTKDTSSATICLFIAPPKEEVAVVKMLLLSDEEQVDHQEAAGMLTFGLSPLRGS